MPADCGFGSPEELVLFGPTVHVEIGFDPQYRPETEARPNLPQTPHSALIDTGAIISCIDSDLAASLQLPVVDRQRLAGAHGTGEVNMHLAQIWAPDLGIATYGRFAGVHLRAGQRHVALLGRTFLRNVSMIYDGTTGAVTLAPPGQASS